METNEKIGSLCRTCSLAQELRSENVGNPCFEKKKKLNCLYQIKHASFSSSYWALECLMASFLMFQMWRCWNSRCLDMYEALYVLANQSYASSGPYSHSLLETLYRLPRCWRSKCHCFSALVLQWVKLSVLGPILGKPARSLLLALFTWCHALT